MVRLKINTYGVVCLIPPCPAPPPPKLAVPKLQSCQLYLSRSRPATRWSRPWSPPPPSAVPRSHICYKKRSQVLAFAWPLGPKSLRQRLDYLNSTLIGSPLPELCQKKKKKNPSGGKKKQFLPERQRKQALWTFLPCCLLLCTLLMSLQS